MRIVRNWSPNGYWVDLIRKASRFVGARGKKITIHVVNSNLITYPREDGRSHNGLGAFFLRKGRHYPLIYVAVRLTWAAKHLKKSLRELVLTTFFHEWAHYEEYQRAFPAFGSLSERWASGRARTLYKRFSELEKRYGTNRPSSKSACQR